MPNWLEVYLGMALLEKVEKGETLEWIMEDKNNIILRRVNQMQAQKMAQ